jgi:eukaryotic-like serine/threonine-protein kinase
MPEWSVPGYAAIRVLGSGGFGKVMLARHNVSGTLVAIKYLHPDLLADPGFVGMFRGEAQVLASLENPDIVRLYEYVESPSGAAIVMELVNGVSLREILTHQGQTAPEAALVVLLGSLMGLAVAHQRGVVHRDYKPENVLINGHGLSKLTDFGLGARTGDRPVPAGTLMYAAPEQIDGAPASPAGDIYSATATFYECLTGRPPFSGPSAELLRQHHSDPVPLDAVPAPLRPLVSTGMAKDPQRRPADASAFVTQLQAAASAVYGSDWERRGRSHLGEAALLLAGLWPMGAPSPAQGTATQQVTSLRHLPAAKAAIVASAVVAVAAAGTALAVIRHQPGGPSHPAAAIQPVPLQPSPTLTARPEPSLSPAQGPPGTIVTASAAGWSGCSSVHVTSWGRTLGTTSIDGAGAFSLSFAVPSHAALGATRLHFSPACAHATRIPSVTFTVVQASRRSQGTTGTSVPAAPSGLTVTAVDPNDIQLSWQDNSSNETGFEISNGVTSKEAGAGSTTYTWGSLAPGTYMCFKIRAYNSAGDSAWDPNASPWYQCTTTPNAKT